MKNILSITGVRSFPEQKTLTGTVVSSGTAVTGTGTNFFSLFLNPNSGNNAMKYAYLLHPVTGEIREITLVQSATKLQIKTQFTTSLSGQNFTVVGIDYLESISILPAANTTLYQANDTGTILLADVSVNVGDEFGIRFPLSINAAGSAAQITVL